MMLEENTGHRNLPWRDQAASNSQLFECLLFRNCVHRLAIVDQFDCFCRTNSFAAFVIVTRNNIPYITWDQKWDPRFLLSRERMAH